MLGLRRWESRLVVALLTVGPAALTGAAGASHAAASGPAAPRYVLTDLGVLGGLSSHGFGVGSRGAAVGHADTSPGSKESGFHAIRWLPDRPFATTGVMSDVGAGIDASSVATAVDFRGVAVGETDDREGGGDAFYVDRRMHVLPAFGGSSAATDINDHRQVVGEAVLPSGSWHPVLWTLPRNGHRGVRLVDLGVPSPWIAGVATGVNERGQVVASLLDSDYMGHAAVWTPSTVRGTHGRWQVVAAPAGSESLGIDDVNDHGVMVGTATGGVNGDRAIRYDGNGLHLLPLLPGGASSYAFAVNNGGDAVGYGDDGTGDRAVLFTGGRVVDLNTRLAPSVASRYVLRSAYDINDRGQIVGTATVGGHFHAVLLTPVG